MATRLFYSESALQKNKSIKFIPVLPSELQFDLETLVATAQPRSILVIGAELDSVLNDYLSQMQVLQQTVRIATLDSISELEDIVSNDVYDLGLCINQLDQANKQEGMRILARLRDTYCKQFCVNLVLDADSDWQFTDLLSLGLTRVNQYRSSEAASSLFKYSIDSYKRTPDWLNADNWANPEMWGKYWW